jgi:hypothetical protein
MLTVKRGQRVLWARDIHGRGTVYQPVTVVDPVAGTWFSPIAKVLTDSGQTYYVRLNDLKPGDRT